MKISITEAISKLPLPSTATRPEGVWDMESFRHGNMSLVLYTPEGKDYQKFSHGIKLWAMLWGDVSGEHNGKKDDESRDFPGTDNAGSTGGA